MESVSPRATIRSRPRRICTGPAVEGKVSSTASSLIKGPSADGIEATLTGQILGLEACGRRPCRRARIKKGKHRPYGLPRLPVNARSREGLNIVLAEIARRQHAGQQGRDLTRFELNENGVEVLEGLVRIEPAQPIVRPELDKGEIDRFGEHPAEARSTGGAGVAGVAGVDDFDLVATRAQCVFKLLGKGLAVCKTVAVHQRIAKCEQPQRRTRIGAATGRQQRQDG